MPASPRGLPPDPVSEPPGPVLLLLVVPAPLPPSPPDEVLFPVAEHAPPSPTPTLSASVIPIP